MPLRHTPFAIDGHGRLRVCCPWPQSDDAGRQCEKVLEERLDSIAAKGDPALTQRAQAATQALLGVLHLLEVPSEWGLPLVYNAALWQAFLDAPQAPVFEHDTTQAIDPQAPRFKAPIDRKVCTALVAALLELGLFKTALQLLDRCPGDADRRVVLKHLLNITRQYGGPLSLLNQPECIAAFDALLGQMLAWRNRHGERPYRRFRDPVDALRMQWYPPQDRKRVERQLAARGWTITIEGTGKGGLSARKKRHTHPTPFALDLLVSWFQLWARQPAPGTAAFGVLWDALRRLGVDLGDGSALEPADGAGVKAVQAQIDALDPASRDALADVVRRSCAALFATGHEAQLRGLIRLSLLLKDPKLSLDNHFRQGAGRAVKDHGLACLWILSQSPTPRNTLGQVVPALTEWLPRIESPQAALRFIQDVTAFLSRLHAHRVGSGEAWRNTWHMARSHLLPAMVSAFARRVGQNAQAGDPEWTRLAQWVWVTGAALNLLSPGLFDQPSTERLHVLQANDQRLDSGDFDHCLNHLSCLGGLFHHTLTQLCGPELLDLPKAELEKARAQIKNLLVKCPTDIRSAVLRLPFEAIWPVLPLALNTPAFLSAIQVPPDRAIDLLLQLDAIPSIYRIGWERAMVERLDEPAFARATKAWPANLAMARWVMRTLDVLEAALEQTPQPQGLPNLLDCFRRVTLAATAQQQEEAYWPTWLSFTARFIQVHGGAAYACQLMGAYLPLGPTPLAALKQIRSLALALDGRMLALLLMAWLRQGFVQATQPAPDDEASWERARLFLLVTHAAAEYVEQLSPEDGRKAIKAERRSMALACEQTLKKRL